MNNRIEEVVNSIVPVEKDLYEKARDRLDKMAIPRGSLGRVEEFAQRVAAIQGTLTPAITRKTVVVFAGDHGVVDEGISAFPQEVTEQMVYNFLKGGASINVLSRHVGSEVIVVDMRVSAVLEPKEGLLIKKVAAGTKNIAKYPAMSIDDALKSLAIGMEIAFSLKNQGVDIVGTGDMGIGNTTPSSAMAALLTKHKVDEVTGRGTGIDDQMLKKKVEVITRAIAVNRPDPNDPVDVLAKVGGFEIAGIAGFIIGASYQRMPVVIDGFISTAGALIAVSLQPAVNDYIFASHKSEERGHRVLLEWLKQRPVLDLSMRLGEGTGAALGISMVEAGVKVMREVLTFDEAGVRESLG